jgi:hypothetical protein
MLVFCFDSQFLFFFSCRLVAIWWRVWRARFVLSSNETQAGLKISSLHLADEGLYRCEITYLEINEGCPVVQYVNLTVLGMYQTFRFIFFFMYPNRPRSLPFSPYLCLSDGDIHFLVYNMGEHIWCFSPFNVAIYRLCTVHCRWLLSLSFPPSSVFHISSPLRPGLSELLCSEAAALVSTSIIDRSTREKNNKEMSELFSKAAALQRLINNRSRAGPSYRPA